MHKFNKKSLLAAAVSIALVSSPTTFAQVTDNTNKDNVRKEKADTEQAVEKIEVKGIRGSLNRGLLEKQSSVSFVDSISAEDLGKFPDTNISESLQRIPGVTLEREFGVGATVNLRGLGPQFSLVQINGVSSTSSGFSGQLDEEGGREFDFSLLASELFSRVDVSKTPSASQTEGGLAGVVSLYTPRPLTYSKDDLKFSASAQAAYGDVGRKTTPRTAVFISQNFDDKWGIAASIAKSELNTVVNESGTWKYAKLGTNIGYNATPEDVYTAPKFGHMYLPDDPRYLRNDINKDSIGSTLTLQANLADNLQVTLDNIYVNSKSLREYNRIDATLEWNIAGEPAKVTSETIGGQTFITDAIFPSVQNRVGTQNIDREESFMSNVLSFDWQLTDALTVKPLLGYTKRTGDEETYLYSFYNRTATQVTKTVPGYEFFPAGKTPEYYAQASSAKDFLFNVGFSKDRENSDAELVGKVDFEYFVDGDTLTSIDFGVMNSDRKKTRDYKFWIMGNADAVKHLNPGHYNTNKGAWDAFWSRNDANQDKLLAGSGLTMASVLGSNRSFNVDGIRGPSSLLYIDHGLMQSTYYQGLHGDKVANNIYRANDSAAGSYEINERSFAGYVQANFKSEQADYNLGLRVVKTEVDSFGYVLSGNSIDPIRPDSSYTEFLPSFNLSYDLTDELKSRASYSKTMTRPPLSSLAPSTSIDSSRLEGRKGNTELLPYTSNNFDVGLEWYFSEEALLSSAIFYKRIDSLIEDSVEVEQATFRQQISNELVTAPISFVKPTNGTGAAVKGLEVSFQSPLTFISDKLEHFGTMANFTYTESAAGFKNQNDVRSTSLPGLSKNSMNAMFYFDNETFDARIAYAWRSGYVSYFSESKYQDSYGQFDFSSNYNVTEHLSVQFDVLNMFNSQIVKFRDNNPQLPISVEQLERRYMLGARYSF
jgi:TonB-dependent receptor